MVMAWLTRTTPRSWSSLSSSSILPRRFPPVTRSEMAAAKIRFQRRHHCIASTFRKPDGRTDDVRGVSRGMMSSDSYQQQETKFQNFLVGQDLHHRYFALRHGQSQANVAGVIASDPEVACYKYGLSDLGKEQAQAAGKKIVEQFLATRRLGKSRNDTSTKASSDDDGAPDDDAMLVGIAIVSSDLLRAKETAQIVADTISNSNEREGTDSSIALFGNDIVIDTRLRERYFGYWDGKSDSHYSDVWKDDAIDPWHEIKGVESVWSVVDRSTRCVVDWDSKLSSIEHNSCGDRPGQWWVICVAHGDVLQIMQTGFSKTDPARHRSLDHLETATLRPLH